MNKMMRKALSLALAVLMCITSISTIALADDTRQPREWYVSTDGDDINGTGTIDKPFKTLQKGADMLGPGDTLYIRGGVYNEPFTVTASGTADAPMKKLSSALQKNWTIGHSQNPISGLHICPGIWRILMT